MSTPQRLAVFISFSGEGGVERMVMNLVREFARRGQAVDLLAIRATSAHLTDIPDNVRLIRLKAQHALTSIPELKVYLWRERPTAMLVAKDRAGRAALIARKLARVELPLAIRLGTNLSTALQDKNPLQRWLRTMPMRRIYPWAERVIAVSEGVAEDTRRITGLPAERITVIRNPVITPELAEKAAAPVPHAWLGEGHEVPVIIGAGRLTVQKDFATLIRAFARLRRKRPARLVILGEGKQRPKLEALAQELGIGDDLLMPGFQANLYAWLARADLFVLASRWEGSPNVLTEALALGVPAVATDCPSGPSETLAGGTYGPLLPTGDDEAMAAAMARTLDTPLPPETLRQAVAEYTVARSASHYLEILGLPTRI